MWKLLLALGGVMLEIAAPMIIPSNPHTGYLLVAAGILLFIWAGVKWGQEKNRHQIPKLVVSPKKYDVFIIFDKNSILPNEEKDKPFLLQIQNIGEVNIVKATLRFEVVGLDLQELINNSAAFPIVQQSQHGDIWIATKSNGEILRHKVNIEVAGERTIDLLPAHSQPIEIDMPASVKMALSLFMIASSYGSNSPKPSNEFFDAIKSND